jgi:SAM-dependent methyltransferase
MGMFAAIGRQFALPHGALGRLAGRTMAFANAGMNRFTVECMAVTPTDQILEIGFGPGELIERLTRLVPDGLVAGIDPSETMLAQAVARNRAAVEAGRVDLRLGSISAIPFADRRFDAVCTVNTIYFWPNPAADLAEVRRVLRDGGQVFITFRVKRLRDGRWVVSTRMPAFHDRSIRGVRDLLREAGFEDIRGRLRRLPLVTAACISARAPDRGRTE